jgi:site-specific recombinase XerD
LGFEAANAALKTSLIIRQRSPLTYTHYSHQLASLSLYYQVLPCALSQQQIDAYLVFVLQRTQGKSVTTYKQTVYAIMYYYKHVAKLPCPTLPRVVQHYGLPVVLSKAECKRLFKAPTYLKHRIVLSLIYSGGLRISEAVNLKLQDIDFDRKTIIIRDGKGLKDRCVALSEVIANGIHKYLAEFKPVTWLFNAHTKGKQYSTRSIQSVMQQAIAKAAIDKDASVHALRHSYATHLLEDGVNIVTVQALMGHAKLETTMIYLQLLSKNTQAVKSPLDTLYNL